MQLRTNIRPGFMMELQNVDAMTDKLKDVYDVEKPFLLTVRIGRGTP